MADATPRVLLIEDDRELCESVATYLRAHQLTVTTHSRGDTAAPIILERQPDVLLLDVMLPGEDGFNICSKIRGQFTGAILLLTARGEEADEVIGLELGADDYVIKPVRPRVLLARINRLLGRHRRGPPAPVVCGPIALDPARRRVTVHEHDVEFTSAEFDVLLFLALRAGQVVSREMIHRELLGGRYNGVDRSVDLRVHRIRRKLAATGETMDIIKAIRGVGYMVVLP